MGKFIITKRSNSQYQFNLQAVNGEVILTSEGYTSNSACHNGIESVKENAKQEKNYQRKTAVNNQPYFTLIAANGEVIGTSEMYETPAGRDNGIASVMENAPGAYVDDRS